METSTIYLPPKLELKIDISDEQFWQLCRDNDDLRFEKTASGELILCLPPEAILANGMQI